MLRHFTAPLAAAARDGLNRGVSALVWALAAAGLAVTGLGFLLAAVLIGLSQLMGPLLACGLMGMVLVTVALLISTRRRNPLAATPPHPPLAPPDQIAFAFGFVLTRLILARRGD